MIGINPATDSVPTTIELLKLVDELIERFEIPTQSCVLAHVTTTMEAIDRGAPVDLVFQSIAGTEAANASFGVNLATAEGGPRNGACALAAARVGDNVMYFETGQGSCLSANAHHGVDQQTLEARAYAVARKFEPLLVNTVVGFIGPEYLYDGKQIIARRTGGSLLRQAARPADGLRRLLHQPRRGRPGRHGQPAHAARPSPAATTSWACPAPTTSCSTTSPRRFTTPRISGALLGLRPAPEFEAWLRKMDVLEMQGELLPVPERHPLLSQRLTA